MIIPTCLAGLHGGELFDKEGTRHNHSRILQSLLFIFRISTTGESSREEEENRRAVNVSRSLTRSPPLGLLGGERGLRSMLNVGKSRSAADLENID